MKIVSHSIAELMAIRHGFYQAANPKIWTVGTDFVESYSNRIKNINSSNNFGYVSVNSKDKLLGAVFGKIIDPPGVYNPGVTCLIEDFAVGNDCDWHTVAPKMLQRILSDFPNSQIKQFVFITPVAYVGQQNFFQSIGIYNCSQWWTGKIDPINHSTVQKLQSQNLEDAVELSHVKRLKYSKIAPVFWKMASDSDNVQKEFFASMIDTNSENSIRYIPLVFHKNPKEKSITGLIIGEHHKVPDFLGGSDICKVDDFVVQNEDNSRQWSKVGKPLLEALSFQVGSDMQFKIVSGSHDTAKLTLLKSFGLCHSINWWTTPAYNNLNKPFFSSHCEDPTSKDIEILPMGEILDY